MILDEITDKRITIIHKENGGVSSARNVALDLAKGEYIIFCDPDDRLLPRALETLNKAIIKYPDADWIRGNNIVSLPDGTERKEGLHNKRAPYANQYLSQDLWFKHIVNAGELWATVFKHNKIERIGLRFNPKLRNGEDGLWLYDYTMDGKGVYIAEEVYDYLFQRADGLSFTRAKNEADCISIVEVSNQWKQRMLKCPKGCTMYHICNFNFTSRVRNGIGGLTFVPRGLRMKYIRQLKTICPKIDLRAERTVREVIKAVIYNYFPNLLLLPNKK